MPEVFIYNENRRDKAPAFTEKFVVIIIVKGVLVITIVNEVFTEVADIHRIS